MEMSPLIAVHLSAALAATAIGPLALWAREGRFPRSRLHRAAGYAWVTLMLATAISAIFIRDFRLPNLNGYTPIHLLIPLTLAGLYFALRAMLAGNIQSHRWGMWSVYIGACVIAGAFTLLPSRYLGRLVWGTWLGVL
jgi:uncharacterized membrane protein